MSKATAGKFNADDEAEVSYGGKVIGTLVRSYVTDHSGAEVLGDYGFVAARDVDQDSDLWFLGSSIAMTWMGVRVQSAASARREIIVAITDAVVS